MIRPVSLADLRIIEKFHKENSAHELDFDSILYHGVYEKNGEILAYGAVKEFNEMIISLNKSSNRDKNEAIEELLRACIHLAGLKGKKRLYALADKDFAELLKRHYGFSEIPESLLAIEVNNG